MLNPVPGLPDLTEKAEEEASRYRAMTPEQRAVHLRAVCRSAADLLESHPNADRVLAWRDPLPASTKAWMRRWGLTPGSDR